MPDPRRKTVSATEASALVGASPYVTKWMLYRKFAHGDSIDDPENNRMAWGTLMQPLLLKEAANDLRLEVRPNAKNKYVRRGLLGCTRDAEVICPDRGHGALETKCVFDYRVWMESWGGGEMPPAQNEIQLQQQMLVGNGKKPFRWGVMAAWVCGELKYFPREPMPEVWSELEGQAKAFFDDVKAGREPDPFGAPIEVPLINRVFGLKEKKVLQFVEHERANELAEMVRMYEWAKSERNGFGKEADKYKAQLLALMGDAEEAVFLHGIRLKRKQYERKGYEVKPSKVTTIDGFIPADLPFGRLATDI